MMKHVFDLPTTVTVKLQVPSLPAISVAMTMTRVGPSANTVLLPGLLETLTTIMLSVAVTWGRMTVAVFSFRVVGTERLLGQVTTGTSLSANNEIKHN